MKQGSENYQLLMSKLDSFIRKYYVNKLIRGFLYFTALVLVLFLGFSLLEHQFYFSGLVRKAFLFSFLLVSGSSFFYWVLFPLSKYFHLGSVISHEQAATIIGNHFFDVKDKLLNILQLKKLASETDQKALIEASITQKAERIKLVPFKSAIDLQKNRKYLRYALPPFFLLLILLFAAPSLITDSTNRIIHNNMEFEREAPFKFNLSTEDLSVVQYKDFVLEVEVEGFVFA